MNSTLDNRHVCYSSGRDSLAIARRVPYGKNKVKLCEAGRLLDYDVTDVLCNIARYLFIELRHVHMRFICLSIDHSYNLQMSSADTDILHLLSLSV